MIGISPRLLGLGEHLVELRERLGRTVEAEVRELLGVVEEPDGLAGRADAVDAALAELLAAVGPAELLQRALAERVGPAERLGVVVERHDQLGLDQLAVDL